MAEQELFGPATNCGSLAEINELQRSVVGDEAKQAVVAYGMLVGARSAKGGDYFEDALEVLNCLGVAKAELDKFACHSEPTVLITAEILAKTQKFVDEMTIPCTEWPTSAEVVSCVSANASKYSFAGPWKRLVLGNNGQVIGVEEFSLTHPRVNA